MRRFSLFAAAAMLVAGAQAQAASSASAVVVAGGVSPLSAQAAPKAKHAPVAAQSNTSKDAVAPQERWPEPDPETFSKTDPNRPKTNVKGLPAPDITSPAGNGAHEPWPEPDLSTGNRDTSAGKSTTDRSVSAGVKRDASPSGKK